MKLRNKKTGEIVYATMMASYGGGELQIRYYPVDNAEDTQFKEYRSLAELNEEWEDYKPAEPLIKDEKIRKAVRAWAELSGVDKCHFEHNDGSFTSKWYGISLPTSKYGEDIESGFYTIAELCGEEQE